MAVVPGDVAAIRRRGRRRADGFVTGFARATRTRPHTLADCAALHRRAGGRARCLCRRCRTTSRSETVRTLYPRLIAEPAARGCRLRERRRVPRRRHRPRLPRDGRDRSRRAKQRPFDRGRRLHDRGRRRHVRDTILWDRVTIGRGAALVTLHRRRRRDVPDGMTSFDARRGDRARHRTVSRLASKRSAAS